MSHKLAAAEDAEEQRHEDPDHSAAGNPSTCLAAPPQPESSTPIQVSGVAPICQRLSSFIKVSWYFYSNAEASISGEGGE